MPKPGWLLRQSRRVRAEAVEWPSWMLGNLKVNLLIPHAKDTVLWAVEHADYGSDGRWRCRTTGVILKIHKIWRTIGADSDFPFNGLEVKRVAHVFCPKCSRRQAIMYGNQIALNNLIGYRF